MPDQQTSQELNQDIRTFKESLSGTAPSGIDRKRKQQEESSFEKFKDAYELDTSTFD